MQENRTVYQPQTVPYHSTSQLIQPPYPGFNGAPQPAQYNRKVAIGIGSVQMVIGITCVVMNIVLMNLQPTFFTMTAYGIVGGMTFLATGLVQVISGNKTPQKFLIIAAMVLCILSACVSVFVIAGGIGDALVGGIANCNSKSCYYRSNRYWLTYITLGSIMASLAFIEAVISIVGSAYCCSAVCRRSSNAIPVYFAANQPFMNQGSNTVFVASQNQNLFPGQSTLPQMVFLITQPQAPGLGSIQANPGLPSDHPPSYSADSKSY